MVGAVLTAALSTSLLGAGPALAAVWAVAPSPPTGQDAYINGISARTDADAWAVGIVGQQSSKVGSLPLIDHWNGTTWSQATPPSFPATNGVHLGWVSASSATDVWAVGTINQVKHPGYFGPLTVHWDGSTWTNVPDQLPLNPGTALVGVADVSSTDAYTIGNSASDVWAVGYTTGPQTLTLHWDGTTWTTVSSPNVGSASQLTSVSASPGAAIVWAAGYSGVSDSFNPLTLQNG
jgi:hypothetical protein